MSVFREAVHLLLDPAPGRLRNSLVLVAGVSIVVACWMTFEIPSASTACYVILFVSRGERTSTVASAAGIMVLGSVAIGLAIVVTMVSLSDPPVRVVAMAMLTFGAMFMSRAARKGVPFFAAGFLVVYGLTVSDSVQELGLQPFTASNATETALPGLLFIPPEEALVRTLLWLVLAVVVPAAVVIALNKALVRDPAAVLRQAVADRLAACSAWCEGRPGARARMEELARRGSPELLSLAALAEEDHGPGREPKPTNDAVVRALSRLMLACLALDELGERPAWLGAMAARIGGSGQAPAAPAADRIGVEMDRALDDMQAASADRAAAPKPGFWADDAFGAANVRFALKVTLAVMVCYTLNNATDWQSIGTDVVTCFFVALGSLGESGHKMVLRISGCLFGAALGIGSVVLLMPLMTELAELVLLVGAVTFVAGWIASGSQRVSYAGWQTALAFYTVVLSGFGPVTDMEGAKNRIVGILVGNVVSYLVMATIWPVRARDQLAPKLAEAFTALADLIASRKPPGAARETFAAAVLRMHDMLRDSLYEAVPNGAARIDDASLRELQALVLPASMIAAAQPSPDRLALADWFDLAAAQARLDQLRQGTLALPASRVADDASAGLLHRHLVRLWRESGLDSEPGPAP